LPFAHCVRDVANLQLFDRRSVGDRERPIDASISVRVDRPINDRFRRINKHLELRGDLGVGMRITGGVNRARGEPVLAVVWRGKLELCLTCIGPLMCHDLPLIVTFTGNVQPDLRRACSAFIDRKGNCERTGTQNETVGTCRRRKGFSFGLHLGIRLLSDLDSRGRLIQDKDHASEKRESI